jgi:glycosyltransferase involved in cell wall biosynthesis
VRVLAQIRTDHRHRPGGDTLHAERKAEELRALGVDVDVSGELAADPTEYDLVHLYNTTFVESSTLRRALRARGCGVPIVVETIYWDTSYFDAPISFRHRDGMRRVALALAERAIPNSLLEAVALEQRFPEIFERLRVVPVGVDPLDAADGDAERFCAQHGVEPGFVLCVGRKDLRKNQLRLIRACGVLGVPLVLAGGENPENASYVAACRAAAAGSDAHVLFLPHLEGRELAGAFAAASVHAQPSICETVGLSSLEAAVAGCNVVTTSESGISDYLGDEAWYCDPFSEESIAEAVGAALAAPRNTDLADRLRRDFTWRRAAEETLLVYDEAMREHEARDGTPPLPPDQYAEHLEELVQLQLEAIAFRDESVDGLQTHAANLDAQLGHVRDELAQMRMQLELSQAEVEQARAESAQAGSEAAAARAQVDRTRAELDGAREDLAAARAHLELLQHTRLFRWTAPLRGIYARLRQG